MRLLLTGGGTGGHVSPGLAVASAIRLKENAEFLWVGTCAGLEGDLVRRAGLPFSAVSAGAVRGRSPVDVMAGAVASINGFRQALGIIRSFAPEIVLATGGYVCVPVVLAARVLGIPSVVYLPDVVPGLAVRFLSRIVQKIAVTAEDSLPYLPSHKVVVTGYPVRSELRNRNRVAARAAMGVSESDRVLLILGGSRGARTINEAIGAGLTRILPIARVIHACGASHIDDMSRIRASLPSDQAARYHLHSYLYEELPDALASSDLVIARAGASVMGEFPAVGLPSVLVPYPFAGAHQWRNAEYLRSRGAARIVSNDSARAGELVAQVCDLLQDGPIRASMSAASAMLDRPLAAESIADELSRIRLRPSESRLGAAR